MELIIRVSEVYSHGAVVEIRKPTPPEMLPFDRLERCSMMLTSDYEYYPWLADYWNVRLGADFSKT